MPKDAPCWCADLVLRRAAVTCVLIAALARPAAGAGDAVLAGVATTRGGRVPLAGVLLTLVDTSGRAAAVTRTGERGRFRFDPIAAGHYRLRTQALDLTDSDREVDLPPGRVTELQIELDLLPVAENVDVVPGPDADVPAVQGRLIPVEQLVNEVPLPTGRVEEVLALFPGILNTAGGLSIRGSWRTGQTGLQVDEATLVDPSTGNKPVTLPADAVATVEALASPFTADVGRFSAGITRFHTRAGTESWRLLANGFVPSFRVARSNQLRPVGINGFEPRLTVTGPLSRRVTIAASAQYYFRSHDARSRPANELSTQKEGRLFTRVDAALGSNHALTASDYVFIQRIGASNLNTFNPPGVAFDLRQTSIGASAVDRVAIGAAGLLESGVHAALYDVTVGGSGEAAMTIAPAVNAGRYFNSQTRRPRSWQWTETLTRGASAAGEHRITAGLDLLRSSYDGTSVSRPILVLRADGSVAERDTFGPASIQHAAAGDAAAFVQDHWRPAARVVVDAGWRVTRDGVAASTVSEPRAGLAVDLRGDATSRLTAGVGVYRERTPLLAGTFTQFERRTVTRYASDGTTAVVGPIALEPVVDGPIEPPRAWTWSAGYEQRVGRRWTLAWSYLDRRGRDELILEPDAGSSRLRLSSRGRSRYRGFDASVGYRR
jgi:hypothetical protein